MGGMERGGGAVGLASSGSLSGGERGSSSVSGGGSGLSSSGLVSSGSSSSGSSVGDPSSGVPAAPGDGSCSGRAFAPPPRVRVHPADEPSRRPVDGLSEGRTHPTGATRPTSGTRTGGGAPEAAADAGEAGAPRSSRFLDAAAELLCAAPERMQPLLCAWFDDARPLQRLGGEEGDGPARHALPPEITVAAAAQALLHTHRRLALDALTEALVEAAHPKGDELMDALAEDEAGGGVPGRGPLGARHPPRAPGRGRVVRPAGRPVRHRRRGPRPAALRRPLPARPERRQRPPRLRTRPAHRRLGHPRPLPGPGAGPLRGGGSAAAAHGVPGRPHRPSRAGAGCLPGPAGRWRRSAGGRRAAADARPHRGAGAHAAVSTAWSATVPGTARTGPRGRSRSSSSAVWSADRPPARRSARWPPSC